jgi:F-type H+-transporting ATPase subunit gamma
MSSKKEIRSKISSVQNTQTMTQAMKTMAMSKMAKTQIQMAAGRPYSQAIRSVIGHVALADLAYQPPYLEERAVNRVGFLVVASDRGLCGGLNAKLFKKLLEEIYHWTEQEVAVELALIGSKAIGFFSRSVIPVVAQIEGLGDHPQLADLIGVVKVALAAYHQKKWDRLYLVYNKFVNSLRQSVQIECLLPIHKTPEGIAHPGNWDYLYEPSPQHLLETLLSRFIESQVYQAVVENLACEQSARMVAMQTATDNAGDLLEDLQRLYNERRQASITQELNEIVAGASAI